MIDRSIRLDVSFNFIESKVYNDVKKIQITLSFCEKKILKF